MITALAVSIVDMLCNALAIEEDDKELYTYGFFILLSHLFYLAIAILLGVLLGILTENLLFYIFFMLLRNYAGGFHAKSERVCTLLTILAMLCAIVGIILLEFANSVCASFGLLILGVICIFAFSPLDSSAKQLSEGERQRYSNIYRAYTILFLLLGVCTHIVGMFSILNVISISIGLEGILLLAGSVSLRFSPQKS